MRLELCQFQMSSVIRFAALLLGMLFRAASAQTVEAVQPFDERLRVLPVGTAEQNGNGPVRRLAERRSVIPSGSGPLFVARRRPEMTGFESDRHIKDRRNSVSIDKPRASHASQRERTSSSLGLPEQLGTDPLQSNAVRPTSAFMTESETLIELHSGVEDDAANSSEFPSPLKNHNPAQSRRKKKKSLDRSKDLRGYQRHTFDSTKQ